MRLINDIENNYKIPSLIILIGERIKIFMKIKKIKRTTLAKKLGISYNTMTKKLNGQREFTLDEILKIKNILNLDNE